MQARRCSHSEIDGRAHQERGAQLFGRARRDDEAGVQRSAVRFVAYHAPTVGTASVTFTDGATATFSYMLTGVSRTKTRTRIVFRTPGTACQ